MEQEGIVKSLIDSVESFVRYRLSNKEQRALLKEQCAERLAAEDDGVDNNEDIRYADQAMLANLDWGIEALEEAIDTSNVETRMARLNYAEKMLQVCAMLNSDQKTAGVPNFYLSAWSHMNLSYLWTLRDDVYSSVLHVLEMFEVDPFFSRVDFAPELWKELFLPHMSSIVGWYSEARLRLMMEVIHDSYDLSYTADLDQAFDESLILSMKPNQAKKLQELEQIYGESLNENTRLFAKYYKDCLYSESNESRKRAPMLPIAEPPMTPLHEVSRSIPDYVKFGPILPKSSGFTPVLRSKHRANETRRSVLNHQDQVIPEDDEHDCDDDPDHEDAYSDTEDASSKLQPHSSQKTIDRMPSNRSSKANSRTHSPTIYSPVDSPSKSSCSNPPVGRSRKESKSFLRLRSSRFTSNEVPSSSPDSPNLSIDYNMQFPDSDSEVTVQRSIKPNHGQRSCASFDNFNSQILEHSVVNESDDGSQSYISLAASEKTASNSRPPKDFVCPITGQLFNDPVTLETGQTYERKAIQEWLERGNETCPITRQPLSTISLPKTNFVLKRLITSWKEQNLDLANEFSCVETPRYSNSYLVREASTASTLSARSDLSRHINTNNQMPQLTIRFSRVTSSASPTSVLSQAAIEAIINVLKPHLSSICNSENLKECETAVLEIARLWRESKGEAGVHTCLSKPNVINSIMEILSASLNREVLRASIYILSELICADERVREVLSGVDSDFDCLAALLKNGLAEAAVLICQLGPTLSQLSSYNIIPSIIQLIQKKNEDSETLELVIHPKDAAVTILEQVLLGGDDNSRTLNALSVISANGVPALVKCLDRKEGRRSIVSILVCCMHADTSCRNLIANKVEISTILDLFHAGDDCVRGTCIEFLSEIVKLNRRTFCDSILQLIKDEGALCTMHTLLVYLQMAPMDKQPIVAMLLLQLDLLVEPRKMSIYREEALETLIEALQRKDFFNSQMIALDALISLSGRVTSSGRSYLQDWLLKMAGFEEPYMSLMKAERIKNHDSESTETMEEEQKTLSSWEKKVAFVLCNHEKGSIFKALEVCFKSNSLEMAKSCLVISTWLTYMLLVLPDTSIREIARTSLLDEYVNVIQSSRNIEEKIMAALALRTFISDPAGLEELGKYLKCIYKTLRKLKRHSPVITGILKSLMNLSSVNATELWSCTELNEIESSVNGEVLALLYIKGKLLSSHSDGSIKVWDTGRRALRVIHEAREHTKAVTCLYASSSGDKLYSGSLDKTIRVWAIGSKEINCVQVHDVKEAVLELKANAKVACFISQATGVRVYNWSGNPKHVNLNKDVKSLAMAGDKLYCGCSGYNIQVVDLCTLTSTTFYAGTRKFLGKQVINSLQIHDKSLYAGGSSIDSIAGKVFANATSEITGSFATRLEIQRIIVNNDFIFTATKCGIIEVWLKEKITKIASIKINSGAKITSLASDMDAGMLYAGCSDGKILVLASKP